MLQVLLRGCKLGYSLYSCCSPGIIWLRLCWRNCYMRVLGNFDLSPLKMLVILKAGPNCCFDICTSTWLFADIAAAQSFSSNTSNISFLLHSIWVLFTLRLTTTVWAWVFNPSSVGVSRWEQYIHPGPLRLCLSPEVHIVDSLNTKNQHLKNIVICWVLDAVEHIQVRKSLGEQPKVTKPIQFSLSLCGG